MLRWQDSLAEWLAKAGWHVHNLDLGRMSAFGDFEDVAAARVAAARDLPTDVPVDYLGGGFVVGHDGLDPEPGGLVPAYVLWPDGEERLVETREELAGALRERLDWLCERARELGLEGVDTGREAALGAIDALAAAGELTNAARGPVYHAGCAASVESVARLRWDGFRDGWECSEGPPAEERRHPIHYEFDGAFTQVWRDGFRAGAAAAREHLTAAERAVLAPEPTEQQLRERWIDDPVVRAWSREVNAEIWAQMREVKRLDDEGDGAAARAALASLQERLMGVIREAEADKRPAATKMATSLRRIGASTERLADELAGGEES